MRFTLVLILDRATSAQLAKQNSLGAGRSPPAAQTALLYLPPRPMPVYRRQRPMRVLYANPIRLEAASQSHVFFLLISTSPPLQQAAQFTKQTRFHTELENRSR
jgi:hypothetical protein